MIFTPDYTIEVDGKEIKYLFNTRALRRYCEAKSLELSDLYLKIQKSLTKEADYTEELKPVKDFTYSDLSELLVYGHESWCAYNRAPFSVSDLDKDLWLDTIGGIVAQQKAFADIVLAIANRMVSNGQKKSETTNTETASPGEDSRNLELKAV